MKKQTFRRILSCVLTLLIIVSTLPIISVSALSEITTEDGFVYKRFSGEVWITDYVGDASDLTVPNEIDGYPVVNFDSAFKYCNSIKSVTISEGITTIDSSSFYECRNLETVILPDTITIIDDFAFRYCNNLKNITITQGVQTIGQSAFSDCTSLESISFPNTLTTIGTYAFEGCTALGSISIPESVKSIYPGAFEYTEYYNDGNNWEDSVLYIDTALIAVDKTLFYGDYIIKEGTTCIGNGAFSYCQELTGITIPDSVSAIPDKAFYSCTKLVEIDIPNSVTTIENDAFYNTGYYNENDNWENNNWDYNVLYIDTALYEVEDTHFIDEFVVRDGTTCIADYAFSNCTSYKIITIPEGVRHIGDGTFGNCINLSSLYMPRSITSIGNFAFNGTDSLTDVYFGGSESEWNVISVDYSALNSSLENANIHFESNTPDTPDTPTQPISIEDCSVSLNQTTYTYDGTAKEPEVTVKHGSVTLLEGTDYTVVYSNNTSVGTATVTVTGMGTYSGSVSKNFTIEAEEVKTIPITDCDVTLSKTSFTYDGNAKKPDVTVKYNDKALVSGTDYTVTYENNTKAGSATVTVTGKGNYTGTTSRSFLIINESTPFSWGKDNWNFDNSYTYFGRDSYRKQISAEYQTTLINNLTNSEYQTVFAGTNAWLDDTWGGSCYGMSSLTMLSKEGLFPYSTYKSEAKNLNSLGVPNKDAKLNSLITYYQMLQVKSVIQQQYRTVPYRTHAENIQNIISLLDSNSTVLLGFKKVGWGGHAILAYGYEYGSWSFNGVTYDGCIKICDPNASKAYDSNANIYFNTKTYSWAIPLYSYVPITSAAGVVFNYIGADLGEINEGGYLSGTSGNLTENYVARIDATAISENRSVSKVSLSNGSYMNKNTAPGEIVEDYSYVLGGESEGVVGYTLFDANSAYKVSQANPVELQLTMDYENSNMSAGSSAGTSVLFDNNGIVCVEGEAADFNISMTFDKVYPTDWFSIQVTGTGANTASLEKTEDGYVLSADNMQDITISANNKEATATVGFSTEYTSAYIYEVDINTIGVKVDTDGNGTYETDLFSSESEYELGDVNLDSSINIKDATTIQKHVASIITLADTALSLADYDKDERITVKDATAIQKFIAGIG